MNPRLSNWAMYAEIVSGIAVVVTLVFLALGIRENTAITRAAMFDNTMDGLAELRGHIITNPEVGEMWRAFQDLEFSELDRTTQVRLRQLIFLTFENYQRAYYARQYGVLGDSEWTRFAGQMCRQHDLASSSEDLSQILQSVLTDDFWEFLTTTCALPNR